MRREKLPSFVVALCQMFLCAFSLAVIPVCAVPPAATSSPKSSAPSPAAKPPASSPAAAPLGAGEAWSIKQEGETGGVHKTLITKTGFRSENMTGGIVISAKAPRWDVYLSNRKSKSYCVVPLSKFQGEMSAKLFGADRAELRAANWRLDGPTRNLGHELLRYKMIPAPKVKVKRYRTPFIVNATYWTFKNIEAPPQCQELLAKIYQLPTQVKGIPFRLFVTDVSKGWFESLNTVSAEKVDGTAVSFDVPKGYALKKTQDEVMVDPVSKDVFDSFSKWVEPTLDKKK